MSASPCFAADEAPAAAPSVDVAKLWAKNCKSCHGDDGKGETKAGAKAKVRDLTSAEVKAEMTKETAIKAIREGVKVKDSEKMAMKAYAEKLTAPEIEALADHSLAFK